MLASRADWAKLLLAEVDRWRIHAHDVAPDVVRQLELYRDTEIDRMIRKHWPRANPKLGSQEKTVEMRRIREALAAPGDAKAGKAVFAVRSATCHKLFNESGGLGPDLTGYDRSNYEFWLVGILDPSLEIREGLNA